MTDPRPFWHRDKHADRRPLLLARGQIKTAVRRWFEGQGFLDVDTGCLQVSPGNEAHLHAFRTEFRAESGASTPLYLHTSPEFAMKKLLAAGEERIFSFAPVFRNGEKGPLHAPEFTMLEWYRTEEPYTALFDDCAAIIAVAVEVTGRRQWSWRGRTCDLLKFRRISVAQAFSQHAGIEFEHLLNGASVDLCGMQRQAERIGVRVAPDDTWSDLFSRILAEHIEPKLGQDAVDVLYAYPTHEAALARPTTSDPRFAERFELYACGVELTNGFGELTDAAEQRRRFDAEMAEKERVYGERYPIDDDFLAALAEMPEASGCAMGLDRLVMLATGATHIDQVLWTPQ